MKQHGCRQHLQNEVFRVGSILSIEQHMSTLKYGTVEMGEKAVFRIASSKSIGLTWVHY